MADAANPSPARAKGTKLYVGGVTPPTTEADIERHFAKHGKVNDIWLARKPPGFAFVWFDDPRDAEEAVQKLNGTEISGQVLRVEISSNRPPRPAGVGFGGDRGGDRYGGPPPVYAPYRPVVVPYSYSYGGGGGDRGGGGRYYDDRDRDRYRDSDRRRERSRSPPRHRRHSRSRSPPRSPRRRDER